MKTLLNAGIAEYTTLPIQGDNAPVAANQQERSQLISCEILRDQYEEPSPTEVMIRAEPYGDIRKPAEMTGSFTSDVNSNKLEIDVFSLKAGTGRSAGIFNMRGQGRGAGLTALSGIELNVKQWTTASTGGTGLTPSPNDRTAPVAQATPIIGTGGGTNAVTPGSGGPTYRGGFGFGASGPGGWVAATPDAMLVQSAGYAGSFDIYSVAGTAHNSACRPTL